MEITQEGALSLPAHGGCVQQCCVSSSMPLWPPPPCKLEEPPRLPAHPDQLHRSGQISPWTWGSLGFPCPVRLWAAACTLHLAPAPGQQDMWTCRWIVSWNDPSGRAGPALWNQLCVHLRKGQAATENSPAQLPQRHRHSQTFASCCLSPPDPGARFALSPEKWERARLGSQKQWSSVKGPWIFKKLKIKCKSSVTWEKTFLSNPEVLNLWRNSDPLESLMKLKNPFLECLWTYKICRITKETIILKYSYQTIFNCKCIVNICAFFRNTDLTESLTASLTQSSTELKLYFKIVAVTVLWQEVSMISLVTKSQILLVLLAYCLWP